MAPRRGGGGGSGGGSSADSSSCSDSSYPCSTQMRELYGNGYPDSYGFYSQAEAYAQVILYGIWIIALVVLYFLLPRKAKALSLRLAMVSLSISFVFLAVRYGLIIGDAWIPIGYRYESSIAVLFWRLGMPLLFLAVYQQLMTGTISNVIFYSGDVVYVVLNIVYAIYDFLISSQAIENFKGAWDWYFSDRDFGLTYSPHAISLLKYTPYGSGLAPEYIQKREFGFGDDYLHNRGLQIKIGAAADFVGIALAVFVVVVAGWAWLRGRKSLIHDTTFSLLAAVGLVLSTLFSLIVGMHFVLHNWGVVTDVSRWTNWIAMYTIDESAYLITPAPGFLRGYRTTVNGFPIAQALVEPLGVVVACAMVVLCVRRRKAQEVVDHHHYTEPKP